jgi:hypothetical protein
MLELDEHQRVREIRMFFQHASDANFTGTVEEITGRKVWGFVSRMDTQRDVSSEVFYLEPVASGYPLRSRVSAPCSSREAAVPAPWTCWDGDRGRLLTVAHRHGMTRRSGRRGRSAFGTRVTDHRAPFPIAAAG